MKNRVLGYLITLVVYILSISIVSAHGEAESSPLLTNIQIFLISISISLVVFFVFRSNNPKKLSAFKPGIFSLALLSGLVHILLGISDRILLLGGVGVLVILASPLLVKMNDTRERIAHYSLGILSLVMFIAYFVSNHDIHSILEDYLGLTAKIAEIGVMVGLVQHRRSASIQDE